MTSEAELIRWLVYILVIGLGGAGVAAVGNRVKNRNRRDDVVTAEARVALGHSQFEVTSLHEAHNRARAYQDLAMTERERALTCEAALTIMNARVDAQQEEISTLRERSEKQSVRIRRQHDALRAQRRDLRNLAEVLQRTQPEARGWAEKHLRNSTDFADLDD